VQRVRAFVSAHYYLRLSLRHRHFQRGSWGVFPPCGIQSGSLGPGRILLMYPCGSCLFRVICVFGGNDFLGLIISFLVLCGTFPRRCAACVAPATAGIGAVSSPANPEQSVGPGPKGSNPTLI
jgi:hypothetical protein